MGCVVAAGRKWGGGGGFLWVFWAFGGPPGLGRDDGVSGTTFTLEITTGVVWWVM